MGDALKQRATVVIQAEGEGRWVGGSVRLSREGRVTEPLRFVEKRRGAKSSSGRNQNRHSAFNETRSF